MPPLPRILPALVRTSAASVLLLIAAVCASGQQRGRLAGVVRNAAKAPVAGVAVIAVSQTTGRVARARTASDGRYTFRLIPGAYRIVVEADGAAIFDRENIIVNPLNEATFDIALEEKKKEEAPPLVPVEDGAPAGYAGGTSLRSEPRTESDRQEVRDRWRVGFPEYDRYGDMGARGRDIPFKRGRWFDPYNQSVLKGDYPIIGDKTFLILSGASTSTVEQRRTPVPSNVSTARPGSGEFFGRPESFFFGQTLQFSLELFHGDTVFKPRDWAIKISPTVSLPNYLNAREAGVVNIDVRRGTTRTDTHFSLEEAFGEVKIADVNANYDFISIRAGIQPFVSDFRGFVFSDNNLGARVFGGFENNRYQYNAAVFTMLEKDTNSGLNRFDTRRQNIYVANFFRQDTFREGYTVQASFHYNDDRSSVEFDRNGFLVRPALVGDARPHAIKTSYLGFSSDGHLGRLNLTHSYYFVYGRDTHNPIAGREVRVRSHLAAAETSFDRDYLRFRGSFMWASGDKNPTDDRATGFDAILDDPNFIGGQFSFWNRQGIPLVQTGVGLVQPNSVLPSCAAAKPRAKRTMSIRASSSTTPASTLR